MNRHVKALIDRIDIDEHLGHYQKLTHSQRARLMSDLVNFCRLFKRSPVIEKRMRKLEDRRFTPDICSRFLKKLAPVRA